VKVNATAENAAAYFYLTSYCVMFFFNTTRYSTGTKVHENSQL